MAKGYATCTTSSFSNLGFIKSAPGALSVLRSCSFFWTSAAVIVMSAINSTCISQGKRCSSSGGLIIYADSRYNYELLDIPNEYEPVSGIEVFLGNNTTQN